MSSTTIINNFSNTYSLKIASMQDVIRKLRSEDLKQGHCFMIFDENLPEDQAYYEYPDGNIQIEKLDKRNIEIPRQIVKVLNKSEAAIVRKAHGLNY